MREGLLVDAYNLFYAARASSHARLFPDIKRLAYFLEHYASANGCSVTLAIDGTRYSDEFADTHVLRILFSEAGKSADAVMEAWMARLAPHERVRWVLVSNDSELTRMGSGMGLRVRSCVALVEDLACFARSEPGPSNRLSARPVPRHSREPFNNPFRKLAPVLCLAAALAAGPQTARAAEFGGFSRPQAAVCDPVTGEVYVVNAPASASAEGATAALPPASAEGEAATVPAETPGFVSRISTNRLVVVERFVSGAAEGSGRELRSPGGAAVIGARLYVSDGDRILSYETVTGRALGVIRVEADPAPVLGPLAPGRREELFAADSVSGRIFRVEPASGKAALFADVSPSVRGLAFDPVKQELFAATEHRILRIDRKGKAGIVRKDLESLSGIFLDAAGNLYASDARKGEVYRIPNRGAGAMALAAGGLREPVGIGYDPVHREALIPLRGDGRMLTAEIDDRKNLVPKNA